MRRILILVCSAILVTHFAHGQQDKERIFPQLHNQLFGVDLKKIFTSNGLHYGKIILNDNTELTGLINYNPSTGIVRFQAKGEDRFFSPRNIISFNFQDTSLHTIRLFYSFEYEDDDHPIKQPYFFEVLKEYEDFAILYMVGQVNVNVKRSNAGLHSLTPVTINDFTTYTQNKTVGTEQIINLFIFDYGNEKMKKIQEERIENLEGDIFKRERIRTRSRFIGNVFFTEWMKNYYKQVDKYRVENKLDNSSVIDLIKIIDYYVSIR